MKECACHYDDLRVKVEVCDGRGVITVLQDRFVISKEFVESDESLRAPFKLVEYAKVLLGKARLVVVVPKDRAVSFRLKMLELNHYWLFYYQLFYYDDQGEIFRLDRSVWRRLKGLPPDETRCPEVT